MVRMALFPRGAVVEVTLNRASTHPIAHGSRVFGAMGRTRLHNLST
jgi:hypothetical protein